MGKNEINSFVYRKDFELFKQKAEVFSYQWLKVLFLYNGSSQKINLLWSLPKKYIEKASLRNRFRRWGKENLKIKGFKGKAFVIFLKRDKSFYRTIKRKDFDFVFEKFFECLDKKP